MSNDFFLPPSDGRFDEAAPDARQEVMAPPPAPPRAAPIQAGEVDLSDFEAGAATVPDFTAADFAPPEPERPTFDETKLPPPFPLDGVDLLSPPGFVGDVAAWIDSQCRFPRRRLAVASAIVSVGNIGGLTHEDQLGGITANMMAFCVAASATGKEAVQQAMADLHRSVGIHGAMHGMIKSEKEILDNMIEHQAAFFVVDEFGIFLQKVRNAQKRGGGAHLEGVMGILMSAYSKADSHYLMGGKEKRELRKQYAALAGQAKSNGDDDAHFLRMLEMVDNGLERPFLSLVGYTTPSTFDGVMDREAATQGFIGRAIIVNEPDINPPARKGFRKGSLSPGMAMRLSQLFNGGSFDSSAKQSERVEYSGSRVPVSTDPEAAQMLDDAADWLHRYAGEMGENTGEASVAMARRAYEMIAKVSFILAIPSRHRIPDHVRWAFAYVRQELDAKIAMVFANDNSRSRPEDAAAARLFSFIDPDNGSSTAMLANRAKISAPDVEAILQRMAASGMVRAEEGKRKYRGKPVIVWKTVE